MKMFRTVFQAKDLPAMDLSGTSDPYVRVTLLPDKKHRLDTKVKRRTLNPRWNETLYFQGRWIIVIIMPSRFCWIFSTRYCSTARDDSFPFLGRPGLQGERAFISGNAQTSRNTPTCLWAPIESSWQHNGSANKKNWGHKTFLYQMIPK